MFVLNAEQKNGHSVKSEQIGIWWGYIYQNREVIFVEKCNYSPCGFQVQNPEGKSNPSEIENFGTCTNILSDRANFATNVQAQSKIHHHS